MDATEDLNANVYERIGLSEPERNRLIDLLAKLRAGGNEFDVERSPEVIEEMTARRSGTPTRNGRKGRTEVA